VVNLTYRHRAAACVPIAIAIAIALSRAVSAAALPATVAILPVAPFLEPRPGGDAANFDIVVRNPDPVIAEISEISVLYLDRLGHVLIERRADSNGTVPALVTLGDLTLAAGERKLIFNRFPRLPPDMHPLRVCVRVTLTENADTPNERTSIVDALASFRPPTEAGRRLKSPLAGHVLVWDGHDALAHHRRWNFELPTLTALGYHANGMRYAYDLTRVDMLGHRFSGDRDTHGTNYSFNQPVRSPDDGVVVETENDRPDDGSADLNSFKARPNLMFGNYIVIRLADEVYALLGHLHQGSLRVRVGEGVRAGQTVAAVGNSGTSLFPHLHFQLMTGPNMATAEGVPSAFQGVTLDRGGRTQPDQSGEIDSGDIANLD